MADGTTVLEENLLLNHCALCRLDLGTTCARKLVSVVGRRRAKGTGGEERKGREEKEVRRVSKTHHRQQM